MASALVNAPAFGAGTVVRRHVCRARATSQTKSTDAESTNNKQEIYLGFAKGDYAPREGRTGRTIIDDGTKYPEKNEYTGGWAGGEAGLKQFIEECKREQELNAAAKAEKVAGNAREAQPLGKGSDVIYLGYSNVEARKSGEKGRVLKADGRKYPERTSLTGGFAGGELGLKAYVQSGDVPIANGAGGGRQPQSPLLIAGVVALAATAGGLLLTDAGDLGERVVSGAGVPDGGTLRALSGLDDNTKLLLEAALVLVGAAGTVVGARALMSNVTNSLREGATKLATLAIFWLALFVAVRFVLDSP